jgi:hypothetical protein
MATVFLIRRNDDKEAKRWSIDILASIDERMPMRERTAGAAAGAASFGQGTFLPTGSNSAANIQHTLRPDAVLCDKDPVFFVDPPRF